MRMFCIRRHVFIALALMLTGCSSNNVEEVVYNGDVQKIIVSVKDYDIDDKVKVTNLIWSQIVLPC